MVREEEGALPERGLSRPFIWFLHREERRRFQCGKFEENPRKKVE